MEKIVFATNNKNKLKEIKSAIGDKFEVLSLSDVNIETEIPEDYETLEENAFQKAEFIFDRTGLNVFADDTGLLVDALDGRPGVYSARYAGEHCSSNDNINKLLIELDGVESREARFRTVIALVRNGKKQSFAGECRGEITKEKSGKEGFGYDPVFQPENYSKTFAEMSMEDKNVISHRGIAVKKLVSYLKSS